MALHPLFQLVLACVDIPTDTSEVSVDTSEVSADKSVLSADKSEVSADKSERSRRGLKVGRFAEEKGAASRLRCGMSRLLDRRKPAASAGGWAGYGGEGDLAGQGRVEQADDVVVSAALAEQAHEFRDAALYGAVVAVEHAGLEQLQAGLVAPHLDGAARALRDVDDDDALINEAPEAVHQPGLLRGITGAIGLEHQGAQALKPQDVLYVVGTYAGEEGEHEHAGIKAVVGAEGRVGPGAEDELILVAYRDAGVGQGGVVEAPEGVEALGVNLGGAVAAHQAAVEIDAYLGHAGSSLGVVGGGYLDTGE